MEHAGLANTLARTAVGDGRAVGNAILALGGENVPTIGVHHVAGARVLLLRVVGPARLLSGHPIFLLEQHHLLIVLGCERRLLTT